VIALGGMSRRYRVALLAYPRSFRAEYRLEMLATLGEGDAKRGRPSTREACSLVAHGVAQRFAPSRPGSLIGLVGALALLAALTPDGWWAQSALSGGPGVYPGVVGPPDEVRTPLGLVGLLAMAAVAPRTAAAAAVLVPYASFASSELEMGYGRDALRVGGVETPALALASAGLAVGVWLAAHAMKAAGSRSRGLTAMALLACAAAAVIATVDAIGSQYGSSGPTVPVGPTPIGNLGLALLLCITIAAAAAGTTAQEIRSARPGRKPSVS
jgi:hypothetical protein